MTIRNMKTSLGAGLLVLLASAPLPASLVQSGWVNLTIPLDPQGIYLDLDAGLTGFSEFAGWDVNFVFGGSEIYNSDKFQAVRVGTGNADAFTNIAQGFQVAAGTSFFSTGFGGSFTHLGVAPGQFAPGDEGLIGFKFTTNGNAGPYYGWMRVTLTPNTAGATIHEWSYDNTGAVIVVPESSTYALAGGLAVVALALRRRFRA